MSIRKFLKNVGARAKVSAIVLLLIVMAFGSAFVLSPVITVKGADTGDFDYYKKVTIDHTKVGVPLTGFPVWVYRSSDSNLVGSASEDIAFFSSDNATQYNHEVEVFTTGTGEFGIWVNVTNVGSAADTSFWMYYNDSDSTTEENVAGTWDDNFVLVLHMDDYSGTQVNDSSSNTNHGTKNSTQGTGKMGYGQTMTGETGKQVVNCGHDATLNLSGTNCFTLECWQTNTMDANTGKWISKDGPVNRGWYFDQLNNDDSPRFYLHDGASSQAMNTLGTEQTHSGTWHYLTAQVYYDGTDYVRFIGNGSDIEQVTITVGGINHASGTNDMMLGNRQDLPAGNFFEGTMDEVRISDVQRNDSWLMATYNSTNSPSTFLTFGAQQGASTASSFTLSGYDGNSRITWSGQAGTAVWSNATSYGTLNVNYNVNATDNGTEIRIFTDNLSNDVFAQNITMYVSSDNSNFAVLEHNPGNGNGVFPTNGGNLSINTTTWPSSGAGTDPFPLDGAGWTNGTIYCRFLLAIPNGVAANTYTQDDWKAWWKVET